MSAHTPWLRYGDRWGVKYPGGQRIERARGGGWEIGRHGVVALFDRQTAERMAAEMGFGGEVFEAVGPPRRDAQAVGR